MTSQTIKRIYKSQTIGLLGLLISVAVATSSEENQTSEILVRRISHLNSSNEIIPKILKVTQNGHEEVVSASESLQEPLFTLKSDPVKVQSDFKTVDINVLNRERDKEYAKKVAIIQQDLQSRVKINESESTTKEAVEEVTEQVIIDPETLRRKHARVKEDIESRVFSDYEFLGYGVGNEKEEEKYHYPVKRSDDDYYSDEPEQPQQSRMTTEAPKEEESFFSIFESLFGSSDDESQTKKKSKPVDEMMFKSPEDLSMKENIKTVSDILKPSKPVDEPEFRTQSSFLDHQNDEPEYRIVNNFHASQSHKQNFKTPDSKPNYHQFYRPTEKPYRPYRPHSTNGYEDYDLEEFLDKKETTTPKVQYVSPVLTNPTRTEPTRTTTTTTTTAATTTTTAKTTIKSIYENKVKFPSVQKKNDYINKNRYQEYNKNDLTEKRPEKVIETTTYQKPEIKTTTEIHLHSSPSFETKLNEIKIQETPNFYNLINLPVRYSTKDTAIPLISTSYANTKIQGMGAHKYEKGANGKYPNHKYDQVAASTTKRPNYWATQRTSTIKISSLRPSSLIPKTTTTLYTTSDNRDKTDYSEIRLGLAPAFGGYGSKTSNEIRTQTPLRHTSTTSVYKESTTRRNDEVKVQTEKAQETHSYRPTTEEANVKIKESEKISEKPISKPVKEIYEDYEYESFPAQVQEVKPNYQVQTTNQNYPPVHFINNLQKNEINYKIQSQNSKTTSVAPVSESQRPPEVPEYEYYDYEDISTTTTTTTTTTTPKHKVKYPSLSKDKVKTSSSEKVAVVVPTRDHSFLETSGTSPSTTVPTTADTTTSTTTKATTITSKPSIATQQTTQFEIKKPTVPFYKPSQYPKEPAPVFETINEEDFQVKEITSTKRVIPENPTTAEVTFKPVVVTPANKDQENNVNIVLVPTKETVKTEDKYSQPDSRLPELNLEPHSKPGGSFQPNYDYTTEFTVGVVQGASQSHVNSGEHFVAPSISTNLYGNDEPFRPIPKPPGMTVSFQSVHENPTRLPPKNSVPYQNKRPFSNLPQVEETEPIHEPHEFIPSPQFHRPVEPKPTTEQRPNVEIDYDFEGIQTEPKPGQYVIFSKPQLNPEMNENQLKKKPEISTPPKGVSNVPHFYDKTNQFAQESQKQVVFKEGHLYHNFGKPKPLGSEKTEPNRPIYGGPHEIADDRLSLQLVPPRGTQTEKPFDGNFILTEKEKQESTVNYPRPHWEKNGKPSFLLNNLPNKPEIHGSRLPPIPPQMAPTLIPPSSVPPQRFRRPIQIHTPPMRKNFNEAGANIKPKPNLPNILPQFRPNTKVGSGPYHRPYISSNRRNGMNRYHEKAHGNFPYHIHQPDKDPMMHREFDMAPEIVPKFITNRGKLPSDAWNTQEMQKRFGQGPMNINSRLENLEDLSQPDENQKILKRLQRTPVTTLQMLKQMPGIQTQKTQFSREDSRDPSELLVPPIYKTLEDQPKKKENLYIVYPAKAPQKLQPDNTKVFIVSDSKSQKNVYNFTKTDQLPLLNPNKKGNNFNDKPKPYFPYGFVKPDERLSLNRKQDKDEDKNFRADDTKRAEPEFQEYSVYPEKDERIDMNLHMQSNNQWNQVRPTPDSMVAKKSFVKNRVDHYRVAEDFQTDGIQVNPPSEYHTSIRDDKDSAFTLGAVMHTMSEANRKGQVANASLHDEEKTVDLPKLDVNERISNGKVITVSMPIDVNQKEKDTEVYNQFQAPFQASSTITNVSHPGSQGWSVVQNPDDKLITEKESETTESTMTTKFNFENFKPELIGGFKPIFELPEEPEESKNDDKGADEKEENLRSR